MPEINIYDLCRFWNYICARRKWKENPVESYTKKYQKHIACSYGCKLVCLDYQLSNPFKDFENSTKCWIWGNYYVDDDVKVRDHCHTTGKYWCSARTNCNIKF